MCLKLTHAVSNWHLFTVPFYKVTATEVDTPTKQRQAFTRSLLQNKATHTHAHYTDGKSGQDATLVMRGCFETFLHSGGVESKLGPLGTTAIYWPIVPAPGDCDGEFGGMNDMTNFPLLNTPRRRREWDNIAPSESSKAPSQPIGWNPGREQGKIITNNSKTQISEPNSNKTEERNSSKDQTVLEKSLDDLESNLMEDEVKNVLVTIINLVINSGDAKAMVGHLWKAVELDEQHYNKIQRESTN
jgi:hypothetical protein